MLVSAQKRSKYREVCCVLDDTEVLHSLACNLSKTVTCHDTITFEAPLLSPQSASCVCDTEPRAYLEALFPAMPLKGAQVGHEQRIFAHPWSQFVRDQFYIFTSSQRRMRMRIEMKT